MPGLTAAVMFWVFSEEVRTLDTYESACAQVIPACANATDQITLLPPGFLCQAQRDGKGERASGFSEPEMEERLPMHSPPGL